MDVILQLPLQMLSYLLWWLPVLVLLALLQSPTVKGMIGEWKVRFALRDLDHRLYVPLHDLLLETPEGTTQIDHVVVSPFGIFVIETKNMRGWIFGSEKQAEWTQKIFRKHSRFQNPLRQNFKHCKAVEALLQVPPETVHSLVAFVGNAEAKTEMPPNVFFDGGMTAYIQSFKQVVFTMKQVEEHFIELYVKAVPSTRGSRRRHVDGLRARWGEKTLSPPVRKSRS